MVAIRTGRYAKASRPLSQAVSVGASIGVMTPPGFRGTYRVDDDARGVYSEAAGIVRIMPRAVAVPLDAVNADAADSARRGLVDVRRLDWRRRDRGPEPAG
jgi:hypothetical protein